MTAVWNKLAIYFSIGLQINPEINGQTNVKQLRCFTVSHSVIQNNPEINDQTNVKQLRCDTVSHSVIQINPEINDQTSVKQLRCDTLSHSAICCMVPKVKPVQILFSNKLHRTISSLTLTLQTHIQHAVFDTFIYRQCVVNFRQRSASNICMGPNSHL